MKRFFVGLALLIGSLTLGAQEGVAPATQLPPGVQVISRACPVEMQAQQRGASQLIAVRNGQRSPMAGQRIALTLRSKHSSRFISARVKVHGLTPRGRVLQSEAANKLALEITQSMTVVLGEESNGGATGELALPGFTSVTSIELEEITYDNGTLWKVGEGSVCRVSPDPFMLISGR